MRARPTPRLFRTPREAEQMACEWMRFLGWDDAALTRAGTDGGVDVRARGAVAQGKAEVVKTSSDRLQALYGVATYENRKAVFFSLAGFTHDAQTWAEGTGMLLFQFDHSGHVQAANRAAAQLLKSRQHTLESLREALPDIVEHTEAVARDLGFRECPRLVAAQHLAATIWFHLYGVTERDLSKIPDHPASILISDLSWIAGTPDLASRLLGLEGPPIDSLQEEVHHRVDGMEPFPAEMRPWFLAIRDLWDALEALWPDATN
ncbi:MAG: restriction endonuclease [Actinomycetes bacterium]